MPEPVIQKPTFDIHPVTPERWPDLQQLFGPRGACGGCWCMYWRQTRQEYEAKKGESNRLALQTLVEARAVPGMIAYSKSLLEDAPPEPAGWISFGPRTSYPTLQRSRILMPVDEQPVWSIVCFFVPKKFRRQGLTASLVRAAVLYAGAQGADIVEGYPVEPRAESLPDVFAYTGLPGPFLRAGFVEVARRSETRPILRYFVGENR